MNVLFVSGNFPPEVNAPASRVHEHAYRWVKMGGNVDVVTGPPNFPEGRVYAGYRNGYSREIVDGIRVTRVPVYLAENKGTLRRTLGYVSFMLSAILAWPFLRIRPDVVVGSSPHMFTAIAAWAIAKMARRPFVLEVRDLWPESIVAVGKMRRNTLIRVFERVESFLYRQADHIVVVTESFRRHIEGRGIASNKISLIANGADFSRFNRSLEASRLAAIRAQHGLEGKFVVSYVGTVGLAHGIEVMHEAARRCGHREIVFMVVGTGARRAVLERLQREVPLSNFRLIEKQPKADMPYYLEVSHVSVIHLRNAALFRTVIPSKIFESMAMEKPLILGLNGEARTLVEVAGAGVVIPAEDADALRDAAVALFRDGRRRQEMGRNGAQYVRAHHDRAVLGDAYWKLLAAVATGCASTTM